MTDYSIKRYHEYTDWELIERLKEYSQATADGYVSSRAFSEATSIAEATITNHFGTWKTFCEQAGLFPRYQRKIDKNKLLENLDHVWQVLGRQPRAKEMKQPLSPISVSRYQKEFAKPWYEICAEFLSWKSGTSVEEIMRESQLPVGQPHAHSTHRAISLSLRYEILKKDGFRCTKCGRSPATEIGVELHVDHIVSWANGGETLSDNLQTLCLACNIGKSNRHDG